MGFASLERVSFFAVCVLLGACGMQKTGHAGDNCNSHCWDYGQITPSSSLDGYWDLWTCDTQDLYNQHVPYLGDVSASIEGKYCFEGQDGQDPQEDQLRMVALMTFLQHTPKHLVGDLSPTGKAFYGMVVDGIASFARDACVAQLEGFSGEPCLHACDPGTECRTATDACNDVIYAQIEANSGLSSNDDDPVPDDVYLPSEGPYGSYHYDGAVCPFGLGSGGEGITTFFDTTSISGTGGPIGTTTTGSTSTGTATGTSTGTATSSGTGSGICATTTGVCDDAFGDLGSLISCDRDDCDVQRELVTNIVAAFTVFYLEGLELVWIPGTEPGGPGAKVALGDAGASSSQLAAALGVDDGDVLNEVNGTALVDFEMALEVAAEIGNDVSDVTELDVVIYDASSEECREHVWTIVD